MREEAGFEIGPLKESDLPSALHLETLAQWNQTEGDWRRVMALDARGCFGAFMAGRLIGTITTAAYATELAWIGMVLVDPDYRRRGIATRLMSVALNYAQAAGLATIKLDATREGRPLYEALGFISESVIERWERTPDGTPSDRVPSRGVLPLDQSTQDAVFALDRLAFGSDRSKLLDSLIEDSCCQPLVTIGSGERSLGGYALARRGRRASYIGPLIAVDEPAALTLLDAMLHQLKDQKVYIDLNAGFASGAKSLADRRFVKQRDLIRMRFGKDSSGGTSNLVFGIAGPELG